MIFSHNKKVKGFTFFLSSVLKDKIIAPMKSNENFRQLHVVRMAPCASNNLCVTWHMAYSRNKNSSYTNIMVVMSSTSEATLCTFLDLGNVLCFN